MKSKFIEFKAAEMNGMQFFYFNFINEECKEYSIIIKVIDGKFIQGNCSCIFSSYYKFSKKNLSKNKECRHIIQAVSLLEHMNYIIDKNEIKLYHRAVYKDDEETRNDEEQESSDVAIEQQNGQP